MVTLFCQYLLLKLEASMKISKKTTKKHEKYAAKKGVQSSV
jgi:hypothetical protein